jgi:hypothetical protein
LALPGLRLRAISQDAEKGVDPDRCCAKNYLDKKKSTVGFTLSFAWRFFMRCLVANARVKCCLALTGLLFFAFACGGAGEEFSLGMAQGDYDLQQIAGQYMTIPVPCVLKVSGLKATANCSQGEDWQLAIDVSIAEKEVKGTAHYRYLTGWDNELIVDRQFNIAAKKKAERAVPGKFSALGGDWDVEVNENIQEKDKSTGAVTTLSLVRKGTAWVLEDMSIISLNYRREGEDAHACGAVVNVKGEVVLFETETLPGTATTSDQCRSELTQNQ